MIAKAGKPMVKVVALDAADIAAPRCLGFMAGAIDVPDDFDRILRAQAEVEGIALLTSDPRLAQYGGMVRLA